MPHVLGITLLTIVAMLVAACGGPSGSAADSAASELAQLDCVAGGGEHEIVVVDAEAPPSPPRLPEVFADLDLCGALELLLYPGGELTSNEQSPTNSPTWW